MNINKKNESICELITIDNDFKYINPYLQSKAFVEKNNLFIPHLKPDIKQLSKIVIKADILSKKVIYTQEGYQLIINGIITENIYYIGDNSNNSLHCTKFTLPFYNFINLNHNKIEDIKIRVEDIFIQLHKKRVLKQSMLLFICVIPKKKYYY